MADFHSPRDAIRLTTRAYALSPKRSLVSRIVLTALVVALGAGAGAAAITLWHAHRGSVPVQCAAFPVDEDSQRSELSRTRLVLAQEAAARAAVQKTADKASAEAARLRSEL
ncbi:MAG: hypothetical protein CPDRYMAC_1667 [uncultured Paraburkholderia sp.]|nr:MAG: hypothetical protein CPDRYDRY_1639 [uncultured Paraburkholderia sp.]CAH2919821.1 MAG: hypothetical protein CPDRYMAC_1667 [uncultured Paraburkholderia sp.]